MTEPTIQQEARIYGNRVVRPGDKVEILPVNLREKDEDDSDYFAQKDFNDLRESLGEGPFTILQIGRWPCGRIMLYLKGAKTDEPGAYASDFM